MVKCENMLMIALYFFFVGGGGGGNIKFCGSIFLSEKDA